MSIERFNLPDPGEGLTEAEIVTWRVAVGDVVKVNDIVVEVETAKSLVELPIPFAGVVRELLVPEGQEVEVGTPIIAIDTDVSAQGSTPQPPPSTDDPATESVTESVTDAVTDPVAASPAESATESDSAPGQTGVVGTGSKERTPVLVGYGVKQTDAVRRRRTPPADPGPAAAVGGARPQASPPVRKLAKDLGIDLATLPGSAPGGIITREDVQEAASGALVGSGGGTAPLAYVPSSAGERGETRTPIRGVRKVTAQAMVDSAFTAPHVTEWVTVDVTATMELIDRLKRDREFADVKVTPMLILAKAMCLCVRRHPEINSSWDEDAGEIVTKHYVNLGIAAATPRGLIVPNIKDADAMSLAQLAGAIGELTATAREGRTTPGAQAGGSITLTNVGVFGVDAGTPILNPGEAAIVALGAVRRMPWVIEDDQGHESVQPRWVTQLAMSFDHRMVDGELGSRYLADLAAVLHDPARGLVWG
ncbi:MAG: dihydrolipoamide acetyltransferase family protein [Nostocoides sp.]